MKNEKAFLKKMMYKELDESESFIKLKPKVPDLPIAISEKSILQRPILQWAFSTIVIFKGLYLIKA